MLPCATVLPLLGLIGDLLGFSSGMSLISGLEEGILLGRGPPTPVPGRLIPHKLAETSRNEQKVSHIGWISGTRASSGTPGLSLVYLRFGRKRPVGYPIFPLFLQERRSNSARTFLSNLTHLSTLSSERLPTQALLPFLSPGCLHCASARTVSTAACVGRW